MLLYIDLTCFLLKIGSHNFYHFWFRCLRCIFLILNPLNKIARNWLYQFWMHRPIWHIGLIYLHYDILQSHLFENHKSWSICEKIQDWVYFWIFSALYIYLFNICKLKNYLEGFWSLKSEFWSFNTLNGIQILRIHFTFSVD